MTRADDDSEMGPDIFPETMTEPSNPGHQGSMLSRERSSVSPPQAAFRAMYDEQVDFVWRNLRRMGISEAEVDDRTQEVFVVAHRKWEGFEDLGHGPRAWLFQIVLRVVSDARRHRRRHPEDADGGMAESKRSQPPQQLDEMARKEALEQLDRALATIDLGRRAVLVLHEIEEMTAPEIAKTMNLPLNTVYSRLRVGREELERALQAEAESEDLERPAGRDGAGRDGVGNDVRDDASGPVLVGNHGRTPRVEARGVR